MPLVFSDATWIRFRVKRWGQYYKTFFYFLTYGRVFLIKSFFVSKARAALPTHKHTSLFLPAVNVEHKKVVRHLCVTKHFTAVIYQCLIS